MFFIQNDGFFEESAKFCVENMYFCDFLAFDTLSEWCFSWYNIASRSHQNRIKIASRSHQDRIKIASTSHQHRINMVMPHVVELVDPEVTAFLFTVRDSGLEDQRAKKAQYKKPYSWPKEKDGLLFPGPKCTDTPRNFCHATKSARCIGCVEKFLKRTDTPRNFCHSTKGARCIRCVKNFSMCTDTP